MEELTTNQYLQWSQQYEAVYQVTLADEEKEFEFDFYFRPIGREEYKLILQMNLDLGELQEVICQTAVLYPEYDFTQGRAGIAEILSTHILDISGVLYEEQPQQLLEQFRTELITFDYRADCYIHEAFPEYSLEEIQSWSLRKAMFYLSRAEWILANLKRVPVLELETLINKQILELQNQTAKAEQPVMTEDQKKQRLYELQERMNPAEVMRQRAENSPLAKAPESPAREQQTLSPAALSEAEVMAMLSASEAKQGRNLNPTHIDAKEPFPELAWFKHHEELTGDFE